MFFDFFTILNDFLSSPFLQNADSTIASTTKLTGQFDYDESTGKYTTVLGLSTDAKAKDVEVEVSKNRHVLEVTFVKDEENTSLSFFATISIPEDADLSTLDVKLHYGELQITVDKIIDKEESEENNLATEPENVDISWKD